MSKSISIRIPDKLDEELSEISNITERPKSFHIKKALEAYFAGLADLQIALDRLHDSSDSVVTVSDIRKDLDL